MDKESLELQRQFTESRTKRINEEIERFKTQRDKLNALIEDDEKEIAQLQESLRQNIEEYLADKPYEAIEYFIKERGFTYTVEDVLEGYRKRKHGYYNSYTMNDCVNNLVRYLEIIEID